MRSLSGRLLLAVSLLFVVFFGITILLLDRAFRVSAEAAIRDRLDVQLRVLLGAAEPVFDPAPSLDIVEALPEARFESLESGLYGQIEDGAGELIWRSPSAVGAGLAGLPTLSPGTRRFVRMQTRNQEEVFALTLGIEYEFGDGELLPFTFTVAEHLLPYRDEVDGFRSALFGWFALLTVVLLTSQALLLRLLLRPLRRVQEEIVAVERGDAPALGADYPKELQGVTANLNALVMGERERLARYRDTLGNLAHSLKTPMAVIRSTLAKDVSTTGDDGRAVVQEQIDVMQQLVGYQLQRAAAWGATALGVQPVQVAPVARKLHRSLLKVYGRKNIKWDLELSEEAIFFGEEGDLMEVLGNLLDNACKWCEERVTLTAQPLPAAGQRRRPGVVLRVEDDGPGMAPGEVERLLERGTRADQRVEGHGIGLSIVREIVHLYGGRLHVAASARLGGAGVEVSFGDD